MAYILECKYCGQKIKWQKCIQHLKVEHSLYSTNVYSHYINLGKIENPKNGYGDELNFTCPYCKVRLKSKHRLDQHVHKQHKKILRKRGTKNKHPENFTYECQLCGLKFKSKTAVNHHKWKSHFEPDSIKGTNKKIKIFSTIQKEKDSIYEPPKNKDKPFACGDFLGIGPKYIQIYYSGFETNRRKH